MYEFEVLLRNGERTIVFGYNYRDALNRSSLAGNEVDCLLSQEYVD